jgi:hypothetical protein
MAELIWMVFLILVTQTESEFSTSIQGRSAVPGGLMDYFVVGISVAVVLVSFFLLVRYFVLPKEKDENHIKRKILKDKIWH